MIPSQSPWRREAEVERDLAAADEGAGDVDSVASSGSLTLPLPSRAGLFCGHGQSRGFRRRSAHGSLAAGAEERILAPDPQDDVAPEGPEGAGDLFEGEGGLQQVLGESLL